MRTTEFVTQANFVPGVGMTLDTEDMVERDYYRSTEDIVDELVRAGERLGAIELRSMTSIRIQR